EYLFSRPDLLYRVDQEYIGSLLVDSFIQKKLVILHSPMGSGKTKALQQYLQHIGRSKVGRVLCITTRRMCTPFLADAYGCAAYFDYNSEVGCAIEKDQLHMLERVVVSMESLHTLALSRSSRVYHKYDTVILDEIETILGLYR